MHTLLSDDSFLYEIIKHIQKFIFIVHIAEEHASFFPMFNTHDMFQQKLLEVKKNAKKLSATYKTEGGQHLHFTFNFTWGELKHQFR